MVYSTLGYWSHSITTWIDMYGNYHTSNHWKECYNKTIYEIDRISSYNESIDYGAEIKCMKC